MARKSAVRKPAKMSQRKSSMMTLDLRMRIALTATSMRKMVRTKQLKRVMRRMNLMLKLTSSGERNTQTLEVKMHLKQRKVKKMRKMMTTMRMMAMKTEMSMMMRTRKKSEKEMMSLYIKSNELNNN